MKVVLFLFTALLSTSVLANEIGFEIHWFASEDAHASAIQEGTDTHFLSLNNNPIYFNTVPGSVTYKFSGKGAVHSISVGTGPSSILRVGNNGISYFFHITNTHILNSGTFESVLYQNIDGRIRKICETLIVAGQLAQGSCQSQFHMSLDELDPNLAALLRNLEAQLRQLRKFSKVDEFKTRFKLAETLLKDIEVKDFSQLSESDFASFAMVQATIVSLRKDIGVLQQEIREAQSRIKENLEKKNSLILHELKREGIDRLNPPNLEMKFNPHQGATPENDEGDNFNVEDNIYKTFANKVLQSLQAALKSNDRLGFLAEVKNWTDTIPSYERIALDRQRFSKREWQTHQNQYDLIARFIDEHVDKELWFKDTPVPIEVRQGLRKEMHELAAIPSSDLESALKRLSTKDIQPEQQRAIEAVKSLQLIAKGIAKSASEAIQEFRDLIGQATNAVSSGISCFVKAQVINRLGSFYELITGKSQCDGSELSTTERILAGVEFALGTPKLFMVLGTVAGVGQLVKKIEKIISTSSDALKGVNNMSEFFKTTFGAVLKTKSTKTAKIVQGQSVYRLESKLELSNSLSLRPGTQFYLDGLHKDHLEVFSPQGKFLAVLNLDGTLNARKFEKAFKEGRRI